MDPNASSLDGSSLDPNAYAYVDAKTEPFPIPEPISIPEPNPIPQPIPEPIPAPIPQPILVPESIPEIYSGLKIRIRFQKTSELAGIDSDRYFIFAITNIHWAGLVVQSSTRTT